MRRHHIGSARSCGGLTVESDGASCGKNRRASPRLKRRVVLAARGRCSSFAERCDSADYPICSSSSAEIVTRGTSRKATETTRIDCGSSSNDPCIKPFRHCLSRQRRLSGLPSAGNIEPRLCHLEKDGPLALGLGGSRPIEAFLRVLIVFSCR